MSTQTHIPSLRRITLLVFLVSILLPCSIPADQAPPTLAVATSSPVARAKGVEAVVKLHGAGVDVSVILAFVERTANISRLSADDLVYLQEKGVPAAVMNAMIRRTDEDAAPASVPPAAPTAAAPPAVSPAAPATVVVTPTMVSPAMQPVIYNAPPVVYQDYPYSYSGFGDYRYWGATYYVHPWRPLYLGYGRPFCSTPRVSAPRISIAQQGFSHSAYSSPTARFSRPAAVQGHRRGR